MTLATTVNRLAWLVNRGCYCKLPGFSTGDAWGCQPHSRWPSNRWHYQHQCSLIPAAPPTLVPQITGYMSNGTYR